MSSSPSSDEPALPFRDAEAWLAERGIERERLEVPRTLPPDDPEAGDPGPPAATSSSGAPEGAGASDTDAVTGGSVADATVSARDAARLAGQALADARLRAGDDAALPAAGSSGLEDDVAEALAFVRRSTSVAPQSEGRVRAKLVERHWPAAVIDATLERARRERLVDDPAMAAALVAERRAKGHAAARIRKDLRERGFDDAVLTVALGGADAEDPEAAAFAVAQHKAAGLTAVSAETAYRRVAGYVTRRGYPEGLARKVAREAVFTARDAARTAEH